jgi:hypothetical protein
MFGTTYFVTVIEVESVDEAAGEAGVAGCSTEVVFVSVFVLSPHAKRPREATRAIVRVARVVFIVIPFQRLMDAE